ncbi:MAG: TetR/AcrR family transcriptional regulator [Anaerolineaceae bacterium]|nr:TetR/AcrR family transcriptional regulator [Anaerolineaceae bacterium]
MSKKARLDPRVKRTRKYLEDALLELISEKEFHQISIAEITDRAEVARPTFYLHFNSKEELLKSYLDTIFEDYLINLGEDLAVDNQVLAINLFRQIYQNQAVISLTSMPDVSLFLMERLQEYIRQVLQMFFEKNIIPQEGLNPDLKEFAITSMAGASHAMVSLWIQKGLQYSPEEMGRLFMELIRPGLINVLINNCLQGSFESLKKDTE